MSALDRLIANLRGAEGSPGEWLYVPYSARTASAEHKEAAAELALLRRCRDAVSMLPDEWWRDNWYGGTDCTMCGREISDVDHAPDCQGLAIDALAKEVRGE